MADQISDGQDFSNAPIIMAIDVGNTRAKLGLFRTAANGIPEALTIHACVLDSTPNLHHAVHSWAMESGVPLPQTVAVAGSDPDTRDKLLANWPFTMIRPVIVEHFRQIPIRVEVDCPERVGIDRLLNTFAAWKMVKNALPVIAVDSGTATTVDLMTSDGTFCGGSILPGLRLSAQAMHDYTARLPLLNTDAELSELPHLPGRNTEDAMRAGLFVGQLGAVRELCHRLTEASFRSFKQMVSPAVFVSGGGGRQLVNHLSGAIYVDSLALHGLALLSQAGICKE